MRVAEEGQVVWTSPPPCLGQLGPGWQEGLGTPAGAGPRRQICGPGGWREILHYDNKSLR